MRDDRRLRLDASNEELLCVRNAVLRHLDDPAPSARLEVSGQGGDGLPSRGVEVDVFAVLDVLLVEPVEPDKLFPVGAPQQRRELVDKVVGVAVDQLAGPALLLQLLLEVPHVHLRLDVAGEAVLVETLALTHLAVEAGLLQPAASLLFRQILPLGVRGSHGLCAAICVP